MRLLEFNKKDLLSELKNHLSNRNENSNEKVDESVKRILDDVKIQGDQALIKYTKEFDKIDLKIDELFLSKEIILSYKDKINQDVLSSFKKAIKNVKKFHELQIPKDYELSEKGVRIRSRWKALDSVGLYVPGGQTVYPSSLIMNIVPAIVAGIKRIVCVTPPSKFHNPYVLALLDELGIEEVYQVGGAQAIGALTYGTKTIKAVNKIFGPGNTYVTSAKKQVFGKVGIDLIAGPSEIVVVANEKNNPNWVATDLMAQAEHDINAQSILITSSKDFADNVLRKIKELNQGLSKKDIIDQSLELNGLVILVEDIFKSIEIINYIAPEHLHLHVEEKEKMIEHITNAGCIFMGEYTTEAFGDYILGTNHILPTSGSAKFSSGLGVLDFMKRNSIVEIDNIGFERFQKDVQQMAETEDLGAHKLSVKIRQN